MGEYIHELARAVVENDSASRFRLSLFSASYKDRLSPTVVSGARTIDRRIPVSLLNFAWHRLQWPSVEQMTGESFDVVQSAHPLLIPARRAAQVVTICDLDFLDHPERTRAEIKRDYPRLAAQHAQRAHRVVTISKDTADQVERRLGVPRHRISIATPGAPDWPRRTEEPAEGCVLFFGTIEPRKNVSTLLEAYARLLTAWPGAPRLVLAGRAGEGAAALIARAAAPPLAGHVDVLGYVEPEQRLDVYRRALVLVVPSHTEGFGMPALEAMTLGVPVIAARRGALPEVVGDAGYLFDADEPAELASLLQGLLTDVNARAHMREAGWQQSQQFQWRTSAGRLCDAWQLAVEERARRV